MTNPASCDFFRNGKVVWATQVRGELLYAQRKFWLRLRAEDRPPDNLTLDAYRVHDLNPTPMPFEDPVSTGRNATELEFKLTIVQDMPCPLGAYCPKETP